MHWCRVLFWACLLSAAIGPHVLVWLFLHVPRYIPSFLFHTTPDLLPHTEWMIPAIDNRTGTAFQLHSWFFPASDAAAQTTPETCVIVVHGHVSHKALKVQTTNSIEQLVVWVLTWVGVNLPHQSLLDRAVLPLHQAGLAVLTLDLRNHGQSGWVPPVTFGLYEADDVLTAARWLIQQGHCRSAVGLMGESMGAATVLQAAHRVAGTNLVRAVWADASFVSLSKVATPWFTGKVGSAVGTVAADVMMRALNLQAPEGLMEMDLRVAVRNISAPLMLVHGRQDSTVPWSAGRELLRAGCLAAAPAGLSNQEVLDRMAQPEQDGFQLETCLKCTEGQVPPCSTVTGAWYDGGHCRAFRVAGYERLLKDFFQAHLK